MSVRADRVMRERLEWKCPNGQCWGYCLNECAGDATQGTCIHCEHQYELDVYPKEDCVEFKEADHLLPKEKDEATQYVIKAKDFHYLVSVGSSCGWTQDIDEAWKFSNQEHADEVAKTMQLAVGVTADVTLVTREKDIVERLRSICLLIQYLPGCGGRD